MIILFYNNKLKVMLLTQLQLLKEDLIKSKILLMEQTFFDSGFQALITVAMFALVTVLFDK